MSGQALVKIPELRVEEHYLLHLRMQYMVSPKALVTHNCNVSFFMTRNKRSTALQGSAPQKNKLKVQFNNFHSISTHKSCKLCYSAKCNYIYIKHLKRTNFFSIQIFTRKLSTSKCDFWSGCKKNNSQGVSNFILQAIIPVQKQLFQVCLVQYIFLFVQRCSKIYTSLYSVQKCAFLLWTSIIVPSLLFAVQQQHVWAN